MYSIIFQCSSLDITSVLVQSYLIGLWFSLRTHASQIWQNPQQLLHATDANRLSIYHKLVSGPRGTSGAPHRLNDSLRHQPSLASTAGTMPSRSQTPVPRTHDYGPSSSSERPVGQPSTKSQPPLPSARRVSYAPPPSIQQAGSYAPIVESVDHVIHDTGLRPVQLPENMTSDDFTRAVAVATVSALRHQQAYVHTGRSRNAGMVDATEAEEPAGGHGGHDAPSWSRVTSASVLLACTALYAIIAGEISPSFLSASLFAHRVL